MKKHRLPTLLAGRRSYVPFIEDRFVGTVAAGSVNGTATSDGKGTRIVVDTENKLSISSGLILAGGKASPAYGDPSIWIGPAAGGAWTLRQGDLFATRDMVSQHSYAYAGFDTNATGDPSKPYWSILNNGKLFVRCDGNSDIGESYSATDTITIGVLRLATRHHALRRVGTRTLLAYPSSLTPIATGYFGFSSYNLQATCHAIRGINLPDNGIAVDDTLGLVDYAATPAESATAVMTEDGWVEFKLSALPSAGSVQVRFWSVDAHNYWYMDIPADGSAAIYEVVADSAAARLTWAAGTVGATSRIRIKAVAGDVRMFVDDYMTGSPYATAPSQTGTGMVLASVGTGGALASWRSWRHDITSIVPVGVFG